MLHWNGVLVLVPKPVCILQELLLKDQATVANQFRAAMFSVNWTSLSPCFILLSFGKITLLRLSLRTVPTQQIPLSCRLLTSKGLLKKLSKVKSAIRALQLLTKIQNNRFSSSKLIFIFFAQLQIKFVKISCCAAVSAPPFESPFYGLIFYVLFSKNGVLLTLSCVRQLNADQDRTCQPFHCRQIGGFKGFQETVFW